MIEFISLENYYPYYINLCLFIVLATLLHSYVVDINSDKNIKYIRTIGYALCFILVIYMGLRPISGKYFTDMLTYSRHFNHYSYGGEIIGDKDLFFHYFMKFCASFMNVHIFFLTCVVIYIYPMYRISKVYFKKYWFYSFLMLIVSFSFWTYGTNGIRNGLATSIFLLALSFPKKRIVQLIIIFIAILFHKTILLPTLAYIASLVYNKPKVYIAFWVLCIPMSLALGGFWEAMFASLGFGDDRFAGYLTSENSGAFRFDFLFYSSFAVFTGWYFIIKRNFNDKIYSAIFNTYVISNAFWILIIRAGFSNRFAYLSWFLMALVIIYPFLKKAFYKKQHIVIGRVVFLYFLFTYFMFYIYYSK
ncbi:EpsG family protein [Cellulophaga fucicola]|uniref:EpsG family protein n=1 Tax=Cellulophaga fucicola TaxID=76595 RepID=A0A1K1M0M6_9FLAO|nr:EpsG family protein [Cellulophaga fucicola]SFW16682.1 EpsG family protein [Cellulophaga fucicola]